MAVEAFLKGQGCLWVAPSHNMCRIGQELTAGLLRPIPGVSWSAQRLEFAFRGATIRFRSADNPDRIRGLGCGLAVVDEGGFIDPTLWPIIRPCLADVQGRLIAIGTPNGPGAFVDLANNPDTKLFRFGSADNPFLQPCEIAAMRRDLPPLMARQELDAEIVNMAGSVFPPLSFGTTDEQPCLSNVYVAGVDVGSRDDATVITLGNLTTMSIVNQFSLTAPYDAILPWMQNIFLQWNPQTILIETNGVGQPIYDLLADKGFPVVPWITSNSSKQTLVAQWLKDPLPIIQNECLIREFACFACSRTTGGLYQYAASSGHDDRVMSTLLCRHAMMTGPSVILV